VRGHFGDVLCIILDLNLPGENGMQILSRLRASEVTTPALIVTGRADARIRKEAQRLDAMALFEKPLLACELFAAIESIGNKAA
jgi:FixJ family two-component response regulator